jgi:hypothetical protein
MRALVGNSRPPLKLNPCRLFGQLDLWTTCGPLPPVAPVAPFAGNSLAKNRKQQNMSSTVTKYLVTAGIAILAVWAWNNFVAPKTGLPSA